MTEPLLVDRTDAVATLTLNRPESLNSLNVALKEALRNTLAELASDPTCRAVVLTGAGRGFCAGQDLREHAAALSEESEPLSTVTKHYNPIATALATIDILGPDNIFYETDFPHPTSMSPGPATAAVNPKDYIQDTFGQLPADTTRKILHDNAARVYHLD